MSILTLSIALSFLAALFLGTAFAAPNETHPIINLGYARYQGTKSAVTGVTSYFGIRYAAPPTGNNRWRAPIPIEQYVGYNDSKVQNATSQGPICVQGIPAWTQSTVEGQEDCLTVDVLVPNSPAGSKLAVIVEFHGGGYTLGSAAGSPGYAMVAQAKGNLIFVQTQYRLGAYGFLSSDEVQADGTANAGLLDQRQALKWVQENIAKFGGDPTKVTIHGGSAGGGSVTAQLMLYGGESNPPFRAAIADFPWWQPFHNETVLEFQYSQLLSNTACKNLACLRNVDAFILSNATQKTFNDGYNGDSAVGNGAIYGFGDFYYGPSVDGTIIQDLPSIEFATGRFSQVPFLTDHDGYEGVIFTNLSITTQDEVNLDLTQLWPAAPQSFFNSLYNIYYPRSDYNSSFYQTADIFGDALVGCGTWQLASAFVATGMPTWKFIFDAGSQLHGATAPFLVGTSADGSKDSVNNETLSLLLKDWYISFATNLDPNTVSYSGTSKPNWPQYSQGNSVMSVNYTMLGPVPDPDNGPRCQYMKAYGVDILN